MPTETIPDIAAPPDATELLDWTQHGPGLARRPFSFPRLSFRRTLARRWRFGPLIAAVRPTCADTLHGAA
ncbi:MAG: hypothetical protein QOJ56_952 [Mycobacterium sp.]|jgi:hypothetical protein|nr:hypothetical protein [Mycobacterium sp.]